MIPASAASTRSTAPGDLNGDGRNDLAARNPATGALVVFLQRADGGFRATTCGTWWGSFDLISGSRRPRTATATPTCRPRRRRPPLAVRRPGRRGVRERRAQVPGRFGRYDVIAGGGDLSRDGRRDLLVRGAATGDTYVLPGNGDGTFGRRLGPLPRSPARPRVPRSATCGGNGAPDVVAVVGGTVKAWVNPGTFDLGRPIDTGVELRGADRILDVGDWDRDGYGDVVTRQAHRQPGALARRRARPPRARRQVLATGLRLGRPARRGRRHDRRRLPRPDGPAAQGRDDGSTPGAGWPACKKSYPAYGAITLRHPDRRRPLERRRRPRQPDPPGRHADALPGQRPRRPLVAVEAARSTCRRTTG